MNNYKDVYVIINEGDLVYATYNKEDAISEAEFLTDTSIKDTAENNDWNVNDPSEYDKAIIQNGIDGGLYKVYKVSATNLLEDTEYELSDGTVISVNDVLDIVSDTAVDYEEFLEHSEDYL